MVSLQHIIRNKEVKNRHNELEYILQARVGNWLALVNLVN